MIVLKEGYNSLKNIISGVTHISYTDEQVVIRTL